MRVIFSLAILIIFHFGCNDSLTIPENNNIEAPSKKLTLAEIFNYQNISSIKFSVYSNSIINGDSTTNYNLGYEIYYDLNRSRIIQYYDNKPWLTSGVDFNKNAFWTLDNDTQLVDTSNATTRTAFENYAKNYLCTHVRGDFIWQQDEIIDSMECSVYEDEYQTMEWVWENYKIPIQFKRIMNYDNLHQITTVQLRNIQINIQISDSLFMVPKL